MKQCIIKFKRKLNTIYSLLIICLGAFPVVASPTQYALYEIDLNPKQTPESALSDFLQTKYLLQLLKEKKSLNQHSELIKAENHLRQAEVALSQERIKAVYRALDLSYQKLKTIQLAAMPSRSVEWRGMFIDAGGIPKTKIGIQKMVKSLAKAHFNVILPELFRRGYTLYPGSKYTDQDPEFKSLNFDPVKILAQAAQDENIKIIPWVWVFRVRSPGFGNPILKRLPSLSALPEQPSTHPHFIPRFLSPAHPDSYQYLGQIYQEMINRYPLDGLLLDYIRYDETLPEDQISVNQFRLDYLQKFGHSPPLKLPQSHRLFPRWQLWRENQVHQAVKYFHTHLQPRGKKPFKLGAAIFRGEKYSRLTKMQNWRHWVDQKWIQFVIPMLYTPNPKDLKTWLSWVSDNQERQDWLYPALGSHRMKSSSDLFAQLNQLNQAHIPGVNFFAYSHFDPLRLEDIQKGYFRQKSGLPDDPQEWKKLISELPPLRHTPKSQLNSLLKNKKWPQLYRMLNQLKIRHPKMGYPLTYLTHLAKIKAYTESPPQYQKQPQAVSLKPLPGSKILPHIQIPHKRGAIQIDGKLNDLGWKDAKKIKVGYWYNGLAHSGIDTEVFLTYDQKGLYLGWLNEEPDLSLIRAISSGKDQRSIFEDDSIEVMLGPDSTSYFHFVLNTKNNHYDAKANRVKWNSQWSSRTKINIGDWSAEIFIPWDDLKITHKKGQLIKANFYRNRFADEVPYTAWSTPFGNYHTPKRFGTLELK